VGRNCVAFKCNQEKTAQATETSNLQQWLQKGVAIEKFSCGSFRLL